MKNFNKYLFAVIILPNMVNAAATILQPQQDTQKASSTTITNAKENKAAAQDIKAPSTTDKIANTKTDAAQAAPTTSIVVTETSADKKTAASATTAPSTSAVTPSTTAPITAPVTTTTPPASSTFTTTGTTTTPAQPVTTSTAPIESKITTTATPIETTSKPSVTTTSVIHEELPKTPTPISDIHFETPESAPILSTDTAKPGLDITLEEPHEEGIKIERLEEIKEPEGTAQTLTKEIEKAIEKTDEEKIILECKPIKINGKKTEQKIKEEDEDTDISLSVEPEEEATVSESDEDELSLAKEQQKHLKQAKGVHHADLEVEELDLEDKINAQEEQKEEAFDAAIETL